MQFVVKGMFTMIVSAGSPPDAKQTAERILRHEGIKAVAVEATENELKPRGGTRS